MQRSWKPFTLLVVGIIVLMIVFFSNNTDSIGQGCGTIRYSQDVGEAINLVFLPDNYNDLSTFMSDVETFSNSLLNLKPFDNYQEKFNIYTIKNSTDLKCNYKEAVICDDGRAKRAASKCPNDFIIILSHRSKVADLVNPLRSAAYLNIASINTADSPLVLAHEFGHLFGDFAEEYIADYEIDWDAPNCDPDESCPKFKIVSDSECFSGCTSTDYSRSIKTGIMRNYWIGKTFGSYDEYILEKSLLEDTPRTKLRLSPFKTTQLNNQDDKIMILDFSYESGNLKLINKEITNGYSPNIEKEGYSYTLLSKENTKLYNFSFGYPSIITEKANKQGMSGSKSTLKKFTLISPYSKDVNTISISDPDGKIIAEFPIANEFVSSQGDTISLNLKNFYKEIYFYNENNEFMEKLSLNCKDYCDGERKISYTIPLSWPSGNYFLMYYKNNEWNRINFQVT